MIQDVLGIAKLSENNLEMIKLIYPDVAQPAVRKVGIALETVFDFANTILLPLKLLNDKSKVFFQKHMENYKKKIDELNTEEIGNVPPEMGLPILDELTKTTNDNIAELFINLLLSSSSIDKSKNAHPSFINVIKNLSSDEAKIIQYLIESNKERFLLVSFSRKDIDNQIVELSDSYSSILDLNIDYIENHAFYARNLINLGILSENRHLYFQTEIEEYDPLIKKLDFVKEHKLNLLRNLDDSDYIKKSSIITNKGVLKLTEFGKEFIKAVSAKKS